jgi:mRNA interferase MazF
VVPSAAGAVVLVPFPFSDLSASKLRPALVLADVGRGDWILCQITSNPYGDPNAVPLSEHAFRLGSLRLDSFVRPGKLFTASESLMLSEAGIVTGLILSKVADTVMALISSG